MTDIDIKIQWHSPESCFAAVLVRDGEPWYLNGALVGMSSTPSDAAKELLEQAGFLVENGENFLMAGAEISLEDRLWLFKLLDMGGDTDAIQRRYEAMRAVVGRDPYAKECGHVWYEYPQEGEVVETDSRGFVHRRCTLAKDHTSPVDHHDRRAPNF